MKSKIDFVQGNTKKCLLTMVVPLLMAMILTMAYNLVDSLWVGNLLGEEGYAALTNSTAIALILSAIAMGASNGIAIMVSQAVGAKKQKEGEKIIATVMVMAAVFSITITVVLELFLRQILSAMNTPAELFDMAYAYLSVYLVGYTAIYLYMHCTAVFRSFGDAMFQMKGMLISTLFNAVIDPIMIYFFGLRGAAWATVLSEILCLIFAIMYYEKKKLFHFNITLCSISYMIPLIKDAVFSALQSCIPAISSAVMLFLVTRFGVTTIAAYGVTNKLEIILFYPAMAMNMGLTTIVGQCSGAGRTDRVKDYMKCSLILGSVFLAVVSLLVILFSKNLSGLFIHSSEAADIVKVFFSIVSIGYVLYMITSCFLGELSGLGKPGTSMFLMFIYYIVIRIPLAVLLVRTSLQLKGIWTAILISHIVAAILAAVQGIYSMKGSASLDKKCILG